MWMEDLATEADPVAALIEESSLTSSQVDAALRYRAAYPDEITAHIELHRRETAVADAVKLYLAEQGGDHPRPRGHFTTVLASAVVPSRNENVAANLNPPLGQVLGKVTPCGR
jgi:hypothetical protein